jgi:peptidoglycan hydrolase-like protein with peptidoglycan-binding domain
MQGYLKFGTFAETEGKPVSGTEIRVKTQDGRVLEEMTTDESGQTTEVALYAPPIEYSLEPDRPQPYSLYDVEVNAPGYGPVEIRGLQILPNEEAIQNVMLFPGDVSQPRVISIPPNTLYGTFPVRIPEAEVKPLPPATGLVVLPEVVIPEFIIVHDGIPSNASAPNYWTPFTDYIKNVASSEIYATWPDETLKANILAIISFTLNRVFTEWYRNQGHNFTITSSTTVDQKWIYGRNIFTEISQAVDEIFTYYITRPGIRQPLFTQYNDGRRTNNPGWLSQWGSKALGDRGYNAMEIVRHYYGQDVYLRYAEQVEGVPMSWPGMELQVGSSGPDVRRIQEQLNAVSNNFPAIPKLRGDGLFGENTRISVQRFQEIFNMPATGIVNRATWNRIAHIYVAVERLAEL